MNENIKVTGRLKVDQFKDGKLVQAGEWIDNVVTTVGKNGLASLLSSASAGTSWVTHMAFGSGTTAPAVGDTTLQTELVGNGYVRVAVTRSNPSGNVIQYVSSLTNLTASTTIQEAGLFDASTVGNLRAHQLTGAQTIGSSTSDALQITWQVTFN
jgi:hypothetical protein